MISPWGGLWLLSIAGLALLFGLVAAALRQDMALCMALGNSQGGVNPFGLHLTARLPHAFQGMRAADLLIGLACLLPLAVLAARSRGCRQWVFAMTTIGFAALLFGELAREYGTCAPILDHALLIHLFPAALLTLLAWRVAETLADRMGQ